MTIVLDTNVVVSGFLTPFGSAAQILDLLFLGDIDAALDERIFAEYEEVLRRARFHFDPAEVQHLLSYLKTFGQWVTASPRRIPLPDEEDLPFVEVAWASSADALVTGNLRHFPARSLPKGLRVLTPSGFLEKHF